jgi:transketolase C-terminal domain/subunit
MKRDFFNILIDLMAINKDIYIISLGLGWPRTDELKQKYSDRYIQCEASEQAGLDIAVGLCYERKIPFIYTITPFFLRAFETIRTYINYEKLHCILIGAGRDGEYSDMDGFSHNAEDIKQIMDTQKNINQYYPDNIDELKIAINEALQNINPCFINIHK